MQWQRECTGAEATVTPARGARRGRGDETGMEPRTELEAQIERLGYVYDENERLKRALLKARDRLVDAKSQALRGTLTPRTAIWLQRAIAEIDAAMGDELAAEYINEVSHPGPERGG